MFQKQNEPGELYIQIGRFYTLIFSHQLEVTILGTIQAVTILGVTNLEVTTLEDRLDILKESHLQRPTVCQLVLLLYTTWSRGVRDTNRRRWEALVKPV